ncbi:YraN family protein [Sphingobacterium oryzagri]|uniref:UPF0102 protein PQ465_18630 n=1 Tax=Sphingobacterium oryzagri TaxID=3025669 RepID=A0ABY7WF93_9SPHI|nr:YraN family protein [Sphingobacterium sp. KACC 22765]WDF68299.1 YraN family protein [Sphingobacterium sp. KACC 22765]
MAKHLDSGKRGEQLAVKFLAQRGYDIITLNWRHKYGEIDIIARDKDTLVFIEVKARSSSSFGEPDSFVDSRKQALLIRAADAYLDISGYEGEIRFDIVAVYLHKNDHIELIKDAFWSN